jgi:citrate lyase beta subunit
VKATIPPQSLTTANSHFQRTYPGDSGKRQPVHVVYGGANLFKADTCPKLSGIARKSWLQYCPDANVLSHVTGIAAELSSTVHARITEKLEREAIEDYRVDFEDGYGVRPEAEEDAHCDTAALQMAQALAGEQLPPYCGIRIKALAEESKHRALRTLQRFLNALLHHTSGRLPRNFAVTLPKITVPEQVAVLTQALQPFPGIHMELMMEAPQILFKLPELVALTEGRCIGVHFGPYDYTSQLGITAAHQSLQHPACDFARSMMQVSLAGTGLALSDGPTTQMPIPPHRGENLTDPQMEQNRDVVHRAWRAHYENVRYALHRGIYQGWDLHPAQIPMRYAGIYAFFLEGIGPASERLSNFIQQAAQATRIGEVFDDAATGQGLLNYFLRAMSCGAIPEGDIPALTGITQQQLRTASFAEILRTL